MTLKLQGKCAWVSCESGPREFIYGPIGVGKRRNFRNHAQCWRGTTKSSSKNILYGHMRVGKESSLRNHARRGRGRAGVSEATPFVGGVRH